jgi:hypothetical protein
MFGAPVIASTDPALVEVADGSPLVIHLDAADPAAWIRAITGAAAVPRDPPGIPTAPAGAVTWDENAAMVMSLYRALLHLT